MAPKVATGAEEDVKFLLTIIKQLDGTPDWQRVTDELSLPSKGAASKRFSRLPAKYGITMDKAGTPSPAKKAAKASSVSPDEEETPRKAKATPKANKSTSKKRKVAEVEEDDEVVKSEVESGN